VLPQPSVKRPHSKPKVSHVDGAHGPPSEGIAQPPVGVQVSGEGHVLQFAVSPPQPSLCWPQVPGG
jgi:hypothetical protein